MKRSKQGCVSPWLFNILTNKIVRDTLEGYDRVPLEATNVKLVVFADDVVVIAKSEDLERTECG